MTQYTEYQPKYKGPDVTPASHSNPHATSKILQYIRLLRQMPEMPKELALPEEEWQALRDEVQREVGIPWVVNIDKENFLLEASPW